MKCTQRTVIFSVLLTITLIQLFETDVQRACRSLIAHTEALNALRSGHSPTPGGEYTICHTIHISMVFSGHTESLSVYLAIKSILIHRSSKLHFHFVTDSRNKIVLQAMLNSWLVPGITHDYYVVDQALEIIRKSFTDSPTANCFRTLSIKLNLHLVLPDSVKYVLVIEPTSVVNADLFKLWSITVSCVDQMITLCGEKCVSYCHRGNTILYANTREDVLLHGAMGLNLDRIRSPLQAKNWTKAVENIYLCRPNAVETVIKISQETCDFPTITNLENKDNQELCKTVQIYDGNLLRYKYLKQCKETKLLVETPPNAKKLCEVFAWERVTRRRELPFLLEQSYSSSDEYDVAMSTHLDYNRISLIERVLANWDGPASIAIHVTESQVLEVIDLIMNSTMLRERKNISYHLMFKIGPSYPANAVRSLAHRHVATPYVFFNDIDYMTSYRMYTTVKHNLKKLENISKMAIVIPAFETKNIDFDIPHKKSGVIKLISLNQLWPFQFEIYPVGHSSTNYIKWVIATEPYYIQFKDKYEPYCVLETTVFSFDPRFVARFHNKGSHSTQLHMAGYKFLVLPDCFIIHLPHKVNKQNTKNLLKCGKQWYREWVIEKRNQYNYGGRDVLDVF